MHMYVSKLYAHTNYTHMYTQARTHTHHQHTYVHICIHNTHTHQNRPMGVLGLNTGNLLLKLDLYLVINLNLKH